MRMHRGLGRVSIVVGIGGSSLLATSPASATCTPNISLSPPNNTEMNPWGLVGTPYNVGAGWALTASGGTAGGYDWQGPSQQSPTNGMYLQTGGPGGATNLLIGTPTTAGGPWNIGVGAADYPGGCTGVSAIYPFFVCSNTIGLAPASGALAGGTVGTGYNATINGSGGSNGYAWSMTGSLPPGLSFAGNGVSGAAANLLIQGTPTTAGTYSFQLSVADWPNYNPSDSTAITKCAVVTNDYSITVVGTGTDAGADAASDAAPEATSSDSSAADGSDDGSSSDSSAGPDGSTGSDSGTTGDAASGGDAGSGSSSGSGSGSGSSSGSSSGGGSGSSSGGTGSSSGSSSSSGSGSGGGSGSSSGGNPACVDAKLACTAPNDQQGECCVGLLCENSTCCAPKGVPVTDATACCSGQVDGNGACTASNAAGSSSSSSCGCTIPGAGNLSEIAGPMAGLGALLFGFSRRRRRRAR